MSPNQDTLYIQVHKLFKIKNNQIEYYHDTYMNVFMYLFA